MVLPKVKNGDVFEIETSKGYGYFQCAKEASATDVEVIRVFQNIYANGEAANIESLVLN